MSFIGAAASAAGIAASIIGTLYPILVAEGSQDIIKQVKELTQKLTDKLASNQALLEKATLAYNTKNQSLMNEIFRGSGLGNRAQALARAIQSNNETHSKTVRKINDQNVKIQKAQSELDKASSIAGSSIGGTVQAKEIVDNLNQNIQGGIENAKI
jgi:dihydroxyacetone kinase